VINLSNLYDVLVKVYKFSDNKRTLQGVQALCFPEEWITTVELQAMLQLNLKLEDIQLA